MTTPLLSNSYNQVVETSIKKSVQQLSSLYASMIPEADFVWIASNVVIDINQTHAKGK
jgi:hypothetical protein